MPEHDDQQTQEQAPAEQEQVQPQKSILHEIAEETGAKPGEEGYDETLEALKQLIPKIAGLDKKSKVKPAILNELIADIDTKLSAQVNEILHNESFQKLESAWRGLKFVVDRTKFEENIQVEILDASKEALQEDFEDAADVTQSGLFKFVYKNNYGAHGGDPVGAMVSNYEVGPGAQDLELLQSCASIAAMSHAPFIAAAAPGFFDLEDWRGIEDKKNVRLTGPKFAKWTSFRESEDSRYVGLAMPRFLLRLPYGQSTKPAKSFGFEEEVTDDHNKYLWGNMSFAFATKLTDAFAKYRFCTNVIGPKGGGNVEDLKLHVHEAMGVTETKVPTEARLTDARELELAEGGFIPLVWRQNADNACFFSANSAQKPKKYPDTKKGRAQQTNYTLGTRLPYMMLMNRLAHYIKVLQRENLGRNMTPTKLHQELDEWIRQYWANQDDAPDTLFAKKPIRSYNIDVNEVEGSPGWYKVDLKVTPHFKYEGAYFDLSLVGRLDTAEP